MGIGCLPRGHWNDGAAEVPVDETQDVKDRIPRASRPVLIVVAEEPRHWDQNAPGDESLLSPAGTR